MSVVLGHSQRQQNTLPSIHFNYIFTLDINDSKNNLTTHLELADLPWVRNSVWEASTEPKSRGNGSAGLQHHTINVSYLYHWMQCKDSYYIILNDQFRNNSITIRPEFVQEHNAFFPLQRHSILFSSATNWSTHQFTLQEQKHLILIIFHQLLALKKRNINQQTTWIQCKQLPVDFL